MLVQAALEELTGVVGKSLDALVRARPLSLGDILDNTQQAVVQLGAESGAQAERPHLAGQVLGPVTRLQREDRRSSTAWSSANLGEDVLTGSAARVTDTGPSASLLRHEFPARVGDSRTVLRALVARTEGRKVPHDIAMEDVAAEGEVEDVGGEGERLAGARGRVLRGERRDGVFDGRVEVGGNLVEAGYG